jgi:hypothetical protein
MVLSSTATTPVIYSSSLLEALWQRVLAGCGQHSHELVEGAEGPPDVELDVQAGQVDQVAGKRRVVVRVEPAAGLKGYACV